MMNEQDKAWMQLALDLAKLGEYTVRTNPLVGCVIVKDGQMVGKGLHWQQGQHHAEIEALNMAKGAAKDAVCYVTLEPCSHTGRTGPCVQALIDAGVKEIIIAVKDPDPRVNGEGIKALTEAGIKVSVGLLEKEARALNCGFFSRIERRRPYVRAKIAISVDGRVAMKNGESQWITSPESRKDVHQFRARSSAILTSGKTVQMDDCLLTVRGVNLDLPKGMAFEPPERIIFDRSQRVLPKAKIFQEAGKVSHITQGSFNTLFHWMNEKEINDVWVEAGPTFLGALFSENWIDEWIIYMAPKWLGHESKPMVVLPGLSAISDAIQGNFESIERVGPDFRMTVKLQERQK